MLSILRIVVGFLYMQHGNERLLGFLPGNGQLELISPHAMLTLVPGLAGFLELGGGPWCAGARLAPRWS
ncbi:MAG: hypothetical protein KGL98_09800 [Gammaproteobacteria bacterium]|nr:hypothetical protein [Gammaproteobacteria bacterium]MBU6508925.1 hypothetical protein [Gammaproteobacteria bacterium]MDE1983355.1 hypothetical protein [Gammaproteobacteria bacterium]MDE2108107.1 hypothetical protein [Gammaproteobacteria bacterium]MDE2461531.1 hypothetical protein [Gammaproteobacteria bacterium]